MLVHLTRQVFGFCNPIEDKQNRPRLAPIIHPRKITRSSCGIMFVQFISNVCRLGNEFRWVEVPMFHGKFNLYWWRNMGVAASNLGIPIIRCSKFAISEKSCKIYGPLGLPWPSPYAWVFPSHRRPPFFHKAPGVSRASGMAPGQ